MMFNSDDMAWFAGLLDAEGCFGLRRHTKRPTQVLASTHCGLVDKSAVEHAKAIAEQLYGKRLTLHRRLVSSDIGTRPFWFFQMSTKKPLHGFVQQILPYLRVKRGEALLQCAFLDRAAARRHIGDNADFALCALSQKMKHEGGVTEIEVTSLVADRFAHAGNQLAWLGGYTDGDGSISTCDGTSYLSYSCVNRQELSRANDLIAAVTERPALPISVLRNKEKPESRDQYRVQVQDQTRLSRLLPAIRPYLRVKDLQASAVMAMFSVVRDERVDLEAAVKLLNHDSDRTVVEMLSKRDRAAMGI
jgi:hypothetical protein